MPQTTKQDPPAREIASARKTITEQDRQLVDTAFMLFKNKNYENCLQQLKHLSELRPHDARVTSNKAVVEYYVSNLSKTDEFTKQLNAAKKQLEFGMVSTGDEVDDIDRSFLLYNQAVLHFHLKQYRAASNILDRLFKIIEPLGDMLAAKVCVLLVELYLLTYQLEQAYGIITFIESVLLSPQTYNRDEGKQTEEQYNLVVSTFKPKIHMFKVRLYLMRRFCNQCKRELKLAMNSSNNSYEALFLKSNLECLRSNYQKSIKLLNSAPKSSSYLVTGHPLDVMYYNDMACVHFAMGKYNLAVHYSNKALEENVKVMKALPPMEKFSEHSGRPLQTLAINRRAEIVYNMGVSLLFADKPSAAFDCLMEAQNVYQCNPRFWLRLAECCVALCQQTRNKKQSTSNKKSEYVRGVIGNGVHRKIVLSPHSQHIKHTRQESAAMPAATVGFANLCLSNAMILLPSESELETNMTTFLQNQKTANDDVAKVGIKRPFLGRMFVDTPPGDPIQTKEAYNLRVSVLACHAYVALELGDYYKSLEYAQALLRMSHITGPHRFLAHVYLAESLIKLDKIAEAIQELSPEHLKPFTSYDEESIELKTLKPFPKTIIEARSIMMMNMAAAYCLHSEYDKCKHILRQVILLELPVSVRSHAILLSVYCELQTGNVEAALSLIKRSEVFPSGRLIDRVEAARALSGMQLPQQYQLGPNDSDTRYQLAPGGDLRPQLGRETWRTTQLPIESTSMPNSFSSIPTPPGNLLQNISGISISQGLPLQPSQMTGTVGQSFQRPAVP